MEELINWQNLEEKPYKPLAEYSRKVSADGCVLLRNEDKILPLKSNNKISLFGRSQIEYYRSGAGSGGMVNVEYTVNIVDGIRNNPQLNLNEELVSEYENWLENNKPVVASTWEDAPWCQQEMIPSEQIMRSAAENSDTAVVVLGRISGESRDNAIEKGSWYLSDSEEELLKTVSEYFKRTVVLLNVGNIIDMNWVEKYNIKSVMYIWQGGQEGGNAVADVLCGKVTPSGRLTDTIADSIYAYPSVKNFGDKTRNIYEEDIYVGYRYFETFARERVLYPFGFGLSYTEFQHSVIEANKKDDIINVSVEIRNNGEYKGREVVQLYAEAPQGKLGKSVRVLCGFAKTKELLPGESEIINISFKLTDLSSYDDSGITGNKSCYVLEEGEYKIYEGKCVRCASEILSFDIPELVVTEKLTEAMAPVCDFNVMYPVCKNGVYEVGYRGVSKRTVDYNERIKQNLPKPLKITGDRNIKLNDVKVGKNTLEEFCAQLGEDELTCLVRGEGMSSPKTRPGCAGAFGGVTERLAYYGIPVIGVSDGPSGIRMDNGDTATSMPSGTAIACTWDIEEAKIIYEYLSVELCTHKIDSILGPGINIHRSPLNGRNFEYYSEDPYLTGKMASAQAKGVEKYGNSATIKHFAANSQEFSRARADSVMSERAAREIYLKGFEIAVKDGHISSIMSSYNPINDVWSAVNYEMQTVILRNEWGYNGFVMTDWWPRLKKPDGDDRINLKSMIEAQNDVYMLTDNALTMNDNLKASLENGELTIGQLQRSAINILNYILKSHTFERFVKFGGHSEQSLTEKIDKLSTVAELNNVENNKEYHIEFDQAGKVLLKIEYEADCSVLEQFIVGVSINNVNAVSATVNGSDGKNAVFYRDASVSLKDTAIKFSFPSDKARIKSVSVLQEVY
jgi:beta-glucosidase